ncbi:RNase H domain-containing protein [Aphis craccivora]|uniref:RNase H domain-containing protein n=1 Tax=Aphis craccivora TaxID=307492 RepID=A0A6G0YCY9_APHCR|nr:RNase H domain-containing protein [Aphis craccivora]
MVSDSQASILAIVSNPFLSKCSPIILKIYSLLVSLKIRSFSIYFLWAPGYIGINGNEHVDS